MTIPSGSVLYSQGRGSVPETIEIPVYTNRSPTIYDVRYPLGKRWINQSSNTEFVLTSFSSSQGATSANWTAFQAAALGNGQITQLIPNTGTSPVVPVNGAVSILGDGNILAVGGSSVIELTIGNAININQLTLSGLGGELIISDKNTSTSCCGNATLVGGTITVSCAVCTTSSLVFITPTNLQGSLGFVAVSAVNTGSFTLLSGNAGDVSSYNYLVIG